MQEPDDSAASQARPEPDSPRKPLFQPPKLTFVKPELVKQGDFAEVTAGFFGTFAF